MNDTTPFSEGASDSKILFVAEAPGADEMRRQRPLIGPTGKIFNDSLHRAGLLRTDVAIANVCRERISSIESYFNSKSGRLTEKGLKVQKDLLERIQYHQPNVIVPMGNLALACLYPEAKGRITKWRGSILQSTTYRGVKCIPTIHPAATLRGRGPYVMQYTIAQDYERIKEQGEFPEIQRPECELLVEPTFEQAVDYLRMCKEHTRVGADIETYNYQVSCISFAPTSKISMSIPFVGKYAGEHYWELSEEVHIWKEIATLLEDEKVCKVWQGGVSFDIPFLYYKMHILSHNHIDTMVMHRIAYPDFPASLQYICSIFTEHPYYKDERKLWQTPQKDPIRFWQYNARDSIVTREAAESLEAIIYGDEALKWTYENTMASEDACLYAAMRGSLVDREKLKKLSEETSESIRSKQDLLNKLTGSDDCNVNSSKQMVQLFYGTLGFQPYTSRKTGNPTCDDKALARIIRKYNSPEARLVQSIRGLRKLRDTYIEVEFDEDGRLRCSYDVRGTTTGRYSSRQTPWQTGLNYQNLDPRFKGFLVPDPEEEKDERTNT